MMYSTFVGKVEWAYNVLQYHSGVVVSQYVLYEGLTKGMSQRKVCGEKKVQCRYVQINCMIGSYHVCARIKRKFKINNLSVCILCSHHWSKEED
jgi:hypothetical protein